MIVSKLRAIPGVKLAVPEGAFYVLPEMSAFFGPGVCMPGAACVCFLLPAALQHAACF